MRGSKLFVGNLNRTVTNEQIKELFSTYGEVKEIKIIEGKGFAFLEMSAQAEAEKAKQELNGADFKGRPLVIDEARPPKSKKKNYRRY
jgi:RNA recognition motif-containing protein